MQLITPDVALPYSALESLSKYSIKECARVARKAQPSKEGGLYYRPPEMTYYCHRITS